PWFSASAVAPTLSRLWRLDTVGAAWLTISVQLGFVAGALVSALLTLSDRWSARRLVAGCAWLAGLATVGVAWAPGPGAGIALRMLTGAALAGVYPPGMKIVAGWYREGRGLAIGVLVGALTLGSALPHLVRWAVPAEHWRPVLVIAPAAGGARAPALVTFAVVGSGALGCWLGGKFGDRWGRTLITSMAMMLSGACALAAGLAFGRPLVVLVPLLLVWGVTVVADSAQFSAAVSELAPRELVGTALTLQTSLGFLLTCLTIYLLPWVAARVGWRWSMSLLALGPAGGVWAMLALRRRPEAAALAGGRG